MVWQEAFPPTGGPAFDAETERERRLAAQARAGAEWALTALIARYQPTVVRYLTRLCGDQERARQLAERIFQRMERRLHGPHGGENLRLWLLRSCTEVGLDALRRPHGAPARLGSASVAGLLTEQANSESASVFQNGLRRLRQATGTVGRQARPLVWAQEAAADTPSADPAHAPADTESVSHLDETLDRLDPRDALRHRLVRMTLAELPYGDAQCLALHLVAGLNQAEVAKALGITNSAARKRIVHGLALFSERYSQAVESLGLPVELGFGDARPRAPFEPEPIAEPEPAPVVVPSQASDEPEVVAEAPGEDKLIAVNSLSDQGRDSLSGVSYFADEEDDGESGEIGVVTPERGSAHARRDTPLIRLDTIEPVHQPVPIGFDSLPQDPMSPLFDQQDPAPVSGGLITRVASDAILGPVVDALPVTAVGPDAGGVFGLPGPRSVPLSYELSSNSLPVMHDAPESTSILMNWLDASGLMTPLSFESIAVSTAIAATPLAEDEPLAFEASVAPIGEPVATESVLPADEAPLAFELARADDARETLADLAIVPVESLVASQPEEQPIEDVAAADEPLALVADPVPTPPVVVPVLTEMISPESVSSAPEQLQAVGQTDAMGMTADFDERSEDMWHETPPARPAHGVITRSLEDLWDELPNHLDD